MLVQRLVDPPVTTDSWRRSTVVVHWRTNENAFGSLTDTEQPLIQLSQNESIRHDMDLPS